MEALVTGPERNVAQVNARSIEMVFAYLGIQQRFSFASVLGIPDEVRGQHRILAVCESLNATHYINASGGRALYTAEAFDQCGCNCSSLILSCLDIPRGG